MFELSSSDEDEIEAEYSSNKEPRFLIKNLTDANKLLPAILNFSKSDGSDDVFLNTVSGSNTNLLQPLTQQADRDKEVRRSRVSRQHKNLWSNNTRMQDDGEEIAKNIFTNLEQQNSKWKEMKDCLQKYPSKGIEQEFEVKDLLARGEDVSVVTETEIGTISETPNFRKPKDDSDSEKEDWEEVKAIPTQGIQLSVEIPDTVYRNTKKDDLEKIEKLKINREKRKYQVWKHKVHILCWLGHGNYISRVLNDQEVMVAARSLVPSQTHARDSGDKVDIEYVKQIMSCYKNQLTLKRDQKEDEFRPVAPPLKTILLDSIKEKVVTNDKYFVFIFVAFLRALGLQCRIMFNFITIPMKLPNSELSPLSTKPIGEPNDKMKSNKKRSQTKTKSATKEKKPKAEPKASTKRTRYIANKRGILEEDKTSPKKAKKSSAPKSNSRRDTNKDVDLNTIKDTSKMNSNDIVNRVTKDSKSENEDATSTSTKSRTQSNSTKSTSAPPSDKLNNTQITGRRIDRRVLSSSSEDGKADGIVWSELGRRGLSSSSEEELSEGNKLDVWCEIFVDELDDFISVDVIKGKIRRSPEDIGKSATQPVCYAVGWDNHNYLKNLSSKYVLLYNTATRKLRVDPLWWDEAVRPYLEPKTAKAKKEDEYLLKLQLNEPLPKHIGQYKNHPLYALEKHLLTYEAIYPPDAKVIASVSDNAVYARDCVYKCLSINTWLKEAKTIRLGESPYKVVRSKPDKSSNKRTTEKSTELYGPWQVQDYEPPVAENGIVPRNAYGNVELFKDCMLPKGTVHIKLPGLDKIAKELQIDCARAMVGFDYNRGGSQPKYNGFVICKEFKEIVTQAWVKDHEEQKRKEMEMIELRVYKNWTRLIKLISISERVRNRYGFEAPSTSAAGKD